jgi:hypothetical protein
VILGGLGFLSSAHDRPTQDPATRSCQMRWKTYAEAHRACLTLSRRNGSMPN